MRIGRRPLFFLGVAVVCLALLPFTPAEFRWLNYSMAGLALFWAIALGIEELATLRDADRRREENPEEYSPGPGRGAS